MSALVTTRSFLLNAFQRRWWPAHAALLGLAMAAPLHAAEALQKEDTNELSLSPVEVRAAAEAGSTAVAVPRHASASTSDSAALLNKTAGVSLNAAGGISSLPAIHGLADDRLRIKTDGVDSVASCPNHMNPPLSYVDPNTVGQVKVFAGVTPVSVGGDSIGGTLITESRAPEFAAAGQTLNKGSVGTFYRSNNDARGGNVSLTHANDVFNIRYNASSSQANNYTAGDNFKTRGTTGLSGTTPVLDRATGNKGELSARDEVASTAYETRTQQVAMAYKIGTDLIELSFSQQEVPQELFANQRMDMTDNTQTRVNLRYLGQLSWGSLEAQLYREAVRHEMDFGGDKRFWYGMNAGVAGTVNGQKCGPIGATCASGMPMNTESNTLGARVQANIDLTSRDVLRVGSDFQRYRLSDYWPASGGGMSPGTFENINDGERDRAAVFAEWERQLNAAWLAQVGVRYERVASQVGAVRGYSTNPADDTKHGGNNQTRDALAFNAKDRSQTDNNWDFTALTRYNHNANLDVELGYSRKVRSPNLYERYTWSTWAMAAVMNNFVGDGNGYVGNINLNPETAHTVSTRFDIHSDDRRYALSVTPFYTRVNGYIDAVALPGSTWTAGKFNVLQYENQSARIYGVDVSGRMPLAQNGLGQWGLEGVVNYSNGKNRDTGDELYNIMPLNATLALTQQLGGWHNSVEMVGVKSKKAVSDVRNEIQTDGYALFNVRMSHSWEQVRVDMGIENVADKFYFLPTGGAYTAQGRTMSINGIPSDVAVPGMGRTYYTGVTVNF
ncbi:MAG: TonB-dependent receptor [Pseudomonas sp.]